MGDDVMNYSRIAVVRKCKRSLGSRTWNHNVDIGQMKLHVLNDIGELRSTLIRHFDTLSTDSEELLRYSEINRCLANELRQSDCHSLAKAKITM
jgi:hypothetical protein